MGSNQEHFHPYPPKTPYNYLTQEEADHFLTHGWLKVENAIKPEYMDAWLKDLWVRIGYDEHDKSTWEEEYLFVGHHRQVRCEDFCPKAWNKIVDICGGEDRIDPERERWIGDNFIVNFGSEETTKMKAENPSGMRKGWHTDNDWYRHFLDSSGTACTVVHCFADIPEDAGGTWACEDGIIGVAKYLYDHPEGCDPAVDEHHICAHVNRDECKVYSKVIAKKGDTFIFHGMLPHTASYNYLHYPRIITNPHVTLKEPYNFNRPDGDYSLLEQVMMRALDRSSIPEFKPTRERKFWYPRNWNQKRVKLQAEADRMIAAARAEGRDPSTVDSVVLDPKKQAEFDRTNGLLLPLNEATGLEKNQVKIR